MDWKRVPPGAAGCCRALWDAGYEAYPVGGCVRDLLLGREPGDWDVTTSAPPERVMELFERTVPTGVRHGTVTVLLEGESMEVTTFRREEGYADGRHPDTVRFDATLEEDLSRRDFTINAMALARDGRIVDPFGGQADLERKRIRCVGEPDRRFSEDALRMFRAVRFAAQLGFAPEADIVPAIRRCAPLTARLAPERVRVEVEKTLLSPRPDRAGDFFELGLMPALPARRPQGAAELVRLPARPLMRWAGLFACLERSGMVGEGADFLSGLRLESRVIRACAGGGALWRAGLPRDDRAWRHALAEHGEPACRAGAAMGVVTGAEDALTALDRVLAQRPCVTADALAVTGGDLAGMGLRGREIGAAQARMLALVLDRPEENERERLLAFLKDAHFVKAEGVKAGKNETEPCIFNTMQYN